MKDTEYYERRDYLNKYGWMWKWKTVEQPKPQPRKLFANDEFMFMKPRIRREA